MLRESIDLPRAPRRRASPWTKPRLRLLRRRWAQGARVREIAAELGHGITSNAVIAKIHRLGIARLSPYGGTPGRRHAANRVPPTGSCAGIAPHIGSARVRRRPGS
ncbi:MAG TPA: GcrA family cell cycle regulator [Xanthobacteraceae bacterium]|nr:GcrA family cell cycle regulator [Xanthobacteraceae bacterium]